MVSLSVARGDGHWDRPLGAAQLVIALFLALPLVGVLGALFKLLSTVEQLLPADFPIPPDNVVYPDCGCFLAALFLVVVGAAGCINLLRPRPSIEDDPFV